jgi:hypothetical protein
MKLGTGWRKAVSFVPRTQGTYSSISSGQEASWAPGSHGHCGAVGKSLHHHWFYRLTSNFINCVKSCFPFNRFLHHTTRFYLYGHHNVLYECRMVETAVILLSWLRSLCMRLHNDMPSFLLCCVRMWSRLCASVSHSDGPFFLLCCYECS